MSWMPRIAWGVCAVCALFSASFQSAAQEGSPAGPTDPAELEAFIDGVMTVTMNEHRVVGATVAVVKDGTVVLSKGYGYADRAARKPVDPAKTMFRIGSVSKLFTWTAVMQLVEEGKVDLDTDINEYLKNVEIPATFPEPITLRHILAHTPGFEDSVIGLFSRDEAALRPLDEVLRDELPMRVRPAGALPSYSNHGTALAGLVVQDVSGIPWELYIEQNILEPLAMRNTSVRQPLPDTIAGDMSKGYKYERGRYVEQPFELVPAAPAGVMSASAQDMARFMIAHLQDGQYEDTRILNPDTAQQMRSQLFTMFPGAAGMLHGFIEGPENGVYMYGHGGDTIWFHSMLALIPEHNVGIFVSTNSEHGGEVRDGLITAFFDHYFPVPLAPPLEPPASFAAQASQYEGAYSSIRMSYSTAAKLALLLGMGTITVTSDDEGYLLVNGLEEQPLRMAPVGDNEFRETDGDRTIFFGSDDAGNITHLALGSVPVVAFERLDPLNSPTFHQVLLILCLGIFALALVAWPVAAVLRRRRKAEAETKPRGSIARFSAWLMAAIFLMFAVGLANALGDPMEIVFGMPAAVGNVLWLPLAALPFAALCVVFTVAAWIRRDWPLLSRIAYTTVTLAGVVFLWWINYWNLLGHNYPGA